MGKDRIEEARAGRGKQGQSAERRYKGRQQPGTVADWGSVDGAIVVDAIAAVARTGGALRFGYTRDGGAYAIGVYGDGDPYTVYVRPSESVETVLGDIADSFRN